MNFDELRERYKNNAEFHHLVQTMYQFLKNNNVNISEAKEALYLAALMFEEQNVRPLRVGL